MFIKQFGLIARARRKEKDLLQNLVAAEVGVTAQRLCQIERCRRQPNRSEQAILQRRLGVINGFVTPAGAIREMRGNGRRCRPKSKLYEPPRDRATYVRFVAARKRYPDYVNTMMRRISAREDFSTCHALCHQLVADSAEEILLILTLLAMGALPCLSAPGSLANIPHRIVNPSTGTDVAYSATACLGFPGEFFFSQVSFQSDQWQHRVDILRYHDGNWSVIEMDGYGHDAEADARRDRQIGLPTLRLKPAQLLDKEFDLRDAITSALS